MLVDVVVPEVGESIHEVQLVAWKKHPGDAVEKDEELVEIETEKATVPVIATATGKLAEILKKDGEFAEVGDTLARIEAGNGAAAGRVEKSAPREDGKTTQKPASSADTAKPKARARPAVEKSKPAEQPVEVAEPKKQIQNPHPGPLPEGESVETASKDLSQNRPRRGGQAHFASSTAQNEPVPDGSGIGCKPAQEARAIARPSDGRESRVPMSLLRQTIARRLVEAQRNAALVTTYNEVDMQEVMDLRREFGASFQESFDVKLGFMSFFVKAVVEGLRKCPEINARIEGREIVYQNFYDIGVAIGSGRGLVVPVLRSCERLSFAEIEREIAEFAGKVQQGKIAPHELEGGTFTISNGGVYGSLLSTPIVNPPQSGVLGLHSIQERPVARNGQVVIRPMMYIALTYDHRLVDGREAVGFLRRIKEVIETPARLFLEV